MKILLLLFCFFNYQRSIAQEAIPGDTEFIDQYGIRIILGSDLKLSKPVDRRFLIEHFNSRLIPWESDTSRNNIELVISQISMRERNKSYEVRIISYFLSDEKRPISSPLARVYEMRLFQKTKKFYIKDLKYEHMEW